MTHKAKGKSPGGEASRTLTATRTDATVTITITPDVNPEGGWVITIKDAEWQSFLRACTEAGEIQAPGPKDIGADHGNVTAVQRLSTLREQFNAKVRHAAPATETFRESYYREDADVWGVFANELRQKGWKVEVGDLHTLYGEGVVTIRR